VQVAGFVHYVKHEKNDVNTQVLAAAIVNIGNTQPSYYNYKFRKNSHKNIVLSDHVKVNVGCSRFDKLAT